MSNKLLALIFCLLLCAPLYGQRRNSILGWRYLDIEEVYQKKLEDSLRAVISNGKSLSNDDLAATYNDLAYLLYLKNKGDFSQAFEQTKKSLALGIKDADILGDVYFVRGLIHFEEENPEESLKSYREALKHRVRSDSVSLKVADCYGRIGEVHTRKYYDLDSGLHYFGKEYALIKDRDLKKIKGNNYRNQSACFMERGDMDKASNLIENALSLTEDINIPTLKANCQMIKGNIRFHFSEYENALNNYEEGIKLLTDYFEDDFYLLWKFYVGKLLAFQNLNQLDSALSNGKKAMSIGLKNGLQHKISSTESSISLIYRKKGDYDSAVYFNKKSFDFTPAHKRFQRGLIAFDLGRIYKEWYEKSSMISHLDLSLRALDASISLFSDLDSIHELSDTFINEHVLNSFKSFEPLQMKSEVYLNYYYHEPTNVSWLEKSIVAANFSEKIFWNGYKNVASDKSRLLYRRHFGLTYNLLAQALFELYDRTNDESVIQNFSQYMSRYKSTILYENILLIKELDSESNEELKQNLLNAKIGKIHSDLINPIFFEENHQSTINLMKRVGLNELEKFSDPVEALGSLLAPNELLIDYYWFDHNIYVLSVNKNRYGFHRFSVDKKLKDALEVYTKSLKSPYHSNNQLAYSEFIESSYYLYNQLLAPILSEYSGLNTLTIIPDGKLNFIPFEALVTQRPPFVTPNYRRLDYLINLMSISYSPSIDILKYLKTSTNVENSNSLIISIANNDLKNNNSTIGGANSEAGKISRMISGTHKTGSEGTKKKFLEESDQYGIIHLATHGFVDAKNPLNNGVLFNSNRPSGFDTLRSKDIYSLSLKTDLVFLSSCQSGFGELYSGEGVYSLARDFMINGSNSVLSTLWPYDDNSAEKISVEFYREFFQNGRKKNESLRIAKLNYISSSDELSAHPFFWAGPILIGDNKAIYQVNMGHPTLWVLLLMAVISFTILWLWNIGSIRMSMYMNIG